MNYFLGADLGGTSLRVGAVSGEGEILALMSVPTGPEFSAQDLRTQIGLLAARTQDACGTAPLGIGFGLAGVIQGGETLRHAENLPRLDGIRIATLLEETLGAPVVVENDARCFTLGEALFGAGRGVADVCGIALGTGVGCGLMLGGRFHRGAGGEAGEVCRIPLRDRPLEYHLSTAGLRRAFVANGGREERADGARIADRARSGDQAARRAWSRFARDLRFLCDCVAAILAPEVIVIGGALAQAVDLLRPALDERAIGATRVVLAERGWSAGVIGAAALAMPEGSRVARLPDDAPRAATTAR